MPEDHILELAGIINCMSNKYYTRSGDNGITGILGNDRVSKDHPRLEAVGSLDEANAALGMSRAECQLSQTSEILLSVQRDLYHLMAEVAALPENAFRFRVINSQKVHWLEKKIDTISELIEPINEFIVPGDSTAGASLDFARTVVRRAERRLVQLHRTEQLENHSLLQYINRLSSLCFVLELFENQNQFRPNPTLANQST